MKSIRTLVTTSVIVLAATTCAPAPSSVTAEDTPAPLTVFAASSLGPAFTRIAADLGSSGTITYNFGSSTDLAAQIQSEGTADVFASANTAAMDTVQSDPGVTDRTTFATNRLVIVTPPDDPAEISSIADLARPGIQLVLAADGVPVGDYARSALGRAGILDAALANVVSNEEDDAGVVAKVAGGEADAGIVYTSDVAPATDTGLRSVDVPDDVNVLASYPIAVVDGSAHADAARAFIDYVAGSAGVATLGDYGFGPPG